MPNLNIPLKCIVWTCWIPWHNWRFKFKHATWMPLDASTCIVFASSVSKLNKKNSTCTMYAYEWMPNVCQFLNLERPVLIVYIIIYWGHVSFRGLRVKVSLTITVNGSPNWPSLNWTTIPYFTHEFIHIVSEWECERVRECPFLVHPLVHMPN